MNFVDELYQFSTQHPYSSIRALGIGVLIGFLGHRAVSWTNHFLFPRSQQVNAVARNTLESTSNTSISDSYVINADNAAFEKELQKWLVDPNAIGNKIDTAERIRLAHSMESTSLDLGLLNLTSLPKALFLLTALTELDISNNHLSALPSEIGQLIALTDLSISYNQLTSLPPEIGQLTALTDLEVKFNQLTALSPQIGQLTALTRLDVSRNQLTALPPEIGQLTALTSLSVSCNRLTVLPTEIGILNSLNRLMFVNNPNLNDLPLSLSNLARIDDLNNSATQIPDSIVDAILTSCQAKRNATNVDLLFSRLDLWKSYAKQFNNQEFDLAHILVLEENEKNEVSEWLLRLSNTSEFKHAQKELAEKACAMLKAIKDYPEFKSIFLGQIALNNEACGDRAAQAFNELYVLYRIYTLDANVPLKDKLLILQGCAKTMALREAIRMRIKAHESTGNGEVREDVEIYLYYETNLREELGLITAIKSMIYGQIGKRDWINIESLKQDVKANNMTILSEMEVVQKIALKDESFKEKWDAVSDEFADRMDELDPTKLSNKDYLAEINNIEVERVSALSELTRKWITEAMQGSASTA